MENKIYQAMALDEVSFWHSLSQEEKDDVPIGGEIAVAFFYLNDHEQGRKVADIHSIYRENRSRETVLDQYRITRLFQAALYASLAQNETRANHLWQTVIDLRRTLFPEYEVERDKTAQCWIHEAYALLKLGEYQQVEAPAQIGLEGLHKGKGIDPSARENSREYGLVNVMINLSSYLLSANQQTKVLAQKSLEEYKQENIRYGRLGYGVIFDLQFSYPEVFTPVLPGPDPELD